MRYGRVKWLFKLTLITSLLVFPSFITAQEVEQEPNNPCSSAQVLGAVVLPISIDGSLDYLDVDFFRFTAEPGAYLVANLDGQEGEMSALSDPFLGLFDSNCNLLELNDDANGLNSELRFSVPADGEFILAATSCCDSSFVGSYSTGSYRLSLDHAPPPSVISGRVVDADTDEPLRGDSEPYAQVLLLECESAECWYPWQINSQYTDSEGRFSFDSSWYDGDLNAGIYQLEIIARLYLTLRTDPITLEDGQQLDVGDIALQSQAIAESVNGRLVDAVSGLPLSGVNWPYASVELIYCADGVTCSYQYWVGYSSPDEEGLFRFDSTNTSLVMGWYRVFAYAWDYQPLTTEAFELRENEEKDLGDIALWPPPVTITGVEPCYDLPPEGGKCRYSVQIVSNLSDEQDFNAWSIVHADWIGSELGWTNFQAGQSKSFDLTTGESATVRFSFDVPETVEFGASICPDLWVSLGKGNSYFDTLAQEYSIFCIYKGLTGEYSVMSKQAAKALIGEPHGKLIRRQRPQ
jgi:hypothetical protein